MRRFPTSLVLLAAATALAALPVPASAVGPPQTLAASRALGALDGSSAPINPSFPIDYLAVSWTDGPRPGIRFRGPGGWGSWARVEVDDIPTAGGRTYAALVSGTDADAYQVRGQAGGVEAMAINTTDGPRTVVWQQPAAEAQPAQPPPVTRAQWGADEGLRFSNGEERCTRTFFPTQKLIVHHTVTANNDPDPAATIRAIYFDHVVNRGFCDIAYNFLVDAQGRIYKGRYSGPHNTTTQDTVTGENAVGHGVTGAHTGGFNSGTMGIAILGNYTSVPIPGPARQILVQHLAWEAAHHALDPLGTSTYTNPDTGVSKVNPNISGHRDWTATQCPGETLYQILPQIRQEVAALVGQIDFSPPRMSHIEPRRVRQRSAIIRWRTNEPATAQVQFWRPGHHRRTTPVDQTLERGHKTRVAGLRPGTDYRYRVLGWDAGGNAGAGRPKRFTTEG